MRVLAVGTARDDELDDHEALREVLRHESVTRVTLAPLSAPETTALVRQLGGRRHEAEVARLAEQIWAGSGGNPFFAVETIRAIGQGTAIDAPEALPMPERVRELVVARLERLGETSQRLVPVAAVIGRDFGFELLRRAAGLPELEVVDGLEELVRRRVLRAAGERFDFVHDRIREIADERLLAPRRRLLHRQVAEAIEDLHADDLAPHTGALARHHLESGAWGRASVYLRDAANRAVAHAAYREAVPYFEQALAALERVPAAERRAQDAIDIRLEFRACLGILAELDRVDAILREAEALAEAAGDRARLRRVLNFRGSHHWWMARYHRAEEVFERVARLRPPGSAPSEMERWHIAVTRHALAEYRSAIDVLEESTVDGGDPAGAPLRRSLRMLYRVYSRVELGQFDAACADAERDFQEAMPHSYRLCLAAGARGFTLLRRGDALAAIASLEQAVSLAVEGSFRGFFPNAAGWLGLAYLAADRAGEALALLEDAVRRATPMSRGVSSVMLCEAYLRTDRLEEAGALAQETLATTRRTSERGTEAWTLWLLGGIAARRRATRAGAASGPEARAWYDEALSLATELGMRPLVARCHLGLGSQPAGAGESSERGRHLEIALGMFEEMGMRS